MIVLVSQIASKRKREWDPDDVTMGAERAQQFIKDFYDLPLDKMDSNQVIDRLKGLKGELEKDAINSCWLQQFFQ